MRGFVGVWLGLTVLACAWVFARARLERPQPPPDNVGRWAIAALQAAADGTPAPQAPAAAAQLAVRGPVIALAWVHGGVIVRHESHAASLDAAVREAAEHFAKVPALLRLREQRAATTTPPSTRQALRARFTITVAHERASWFRSVPFLGELSVVPLIEGVTVTLGQRSVHLAPDEIGAHGLWDTAITTPIPDLSFGLSARALAERLSDTLGASADELLERGRWERFSCYTLARDRYPADVPVSVAALESAARDGARFLLRHQRSDGRFTYRYDARRNRAMRGGGYSLPRHAGTAFFLAQAARALDMPEAREGALRALGYVQQHALRVCGRPEHACVGQNSRPDMGSSALTALAAAETLAGGDDPEVRALLIRLTAFIRSMQRSDGELMHVYDIEAQAPIDVQKMYYSGEAAVALLASHRVLGDERDLNAVRPLMRHLTGAGWSFFGSRYFYGEEHWTCQAVAAAADRLDTREALEFCLRWLAYQRALLYRVGQTPWPVHGAIGVGPVIVPRLTSVASRVEAGAPIYALALAQGRDVSALAAQMEAHLGLLLRMRYAPGPAHRFRDPAAAYGAVPAIQGSAEVRNDFVQHAGSAMLAWAEILRARRGPGPQSGEPLP